MPRNLYTGEHNTIMAKSSTEPKLILLIPAHNEEKRLPPVLRDFAAYFAHHYNGEYEIVVVVSNSTDRTLETVRDIAREFPSIRALVFDNPIGKGGALIEGLKLAPKTSLIGFVDADGATGPKSFLSLVRLCDRADCVIGSRRVEGSVIRQLQPTKRIFASKVYHVIVEFLFHMKIKDTQCGAKVMRREAVETIHGCLHIADMAFDVNLLFSMKKAGFSILEAPVEWTDKIGTTVRYFRTSLVMFMSIVRLRIIYSPFARLLKFIRPVEAWLYQKLRNPAPGLPSRQETHRKARVGKTKPAA